MLKRNTLPMNGSQTKGFLKYEHKNFKFKIIKLWIKEKENIVLKYI